MNIQLNLQKINTILENYPSFPPKIPFHTKRGHYKHNDLLNTISREAVALKNLDPLKAGWVKSRIKLTRIPD